MTTCKDWTREDVADLFDLPFTELVFRAMPRSIVRLSAGRESMSEATQALCFLVRTVSSPATSC